MLSLPSAFVVIGRIVPDGERLVLSKLVVQFSFTYGVSRGIFLYLFIHQSPVSLFIETSPWHDTLTLQAVSRRRNFTKSMLALLNVSKCVSCLLGMWPALYFAVKHIAHYMDCGPAHWLCFSHMEHGLDQNRPAQA